MESKCYVITLNWTTGCESDTTSTEVKAVCLTLSEAETTKNHIAQTINWDNYYEGYLDIEPIPFYSDLIEASKDIVKMWPEINKTLPQKTDTEQGQSQAIFVAFHKLESTLPKED